MLKKDVQIGGIYIVKVSGNLARVRITDESSYGGWIGSCLETGRQIRIKTAARLRKAVEAKTTVVTEAHFDPMAIRQVKGLDGKTYSY